MLGEELAKRRIGEVLGGRCELQALLGVGMTGAVYEATHRYTKRSVAVKIMHHQLVSDSDAVVRFLREAKAVAKIGHPAIVAKNLGSTGASAVLTKPGATVGTPSYMSPEQARALPIGPRTDLWSAGALLFHAAAGRPPFAEASVPALLLELVTQRPPRLAEVCPGAPPSLQRAIDGALEPDVDARWKSAHAMADALAA